MTTVPEFTDDQILEALNRAIHEHHFDVVPDLIALLALQAPDKARAALDLIETGIDTSAKRNP